MGSKTARAERQRQREDNTAQIMENILTGGEISKAREAELQRAANAGRGVTFLPGSPTVQGLTQGDGRPVFRTGTTAQDFTGRIVANQPTFGEAIGDASRALFGGQAERPIFTSPDAPPGRETGLDFANMVPAPQRTEGIIPALINKGGIGGLVLEAFRNLLRGQEEEDDIEDVVRELIITFPHTREEYVLFRDGQLTSYPREKNYQWPYVHLRDDYLLSWLFHPHSHL